jgi:CubicO group peptidase (beta-lactamase class C family)
MRALGLIDGWPCSTAAAAVVHRTGVAVHGPRKQPFQLASVTKPLATYAALIAVEEGTVALDEPAGPPGSTVRHLLAHASGLAPDGHAAVAPVGARRIYSNTGFEVLGEHLASAAAMPFETYLQEAVLGPLGMTDTSLAGSPAHAGVSTVDDLVRFATELLEPRLLARVTVTEATAVQFPGLAGVLPGFGRHIPNDWGLGFELRSHKQPHWTGSRNSPATFGHFGRSGTFLWVDPVAGVSCIALTDLVFGPWAADAWPRFADAVLAELDH